jgi:hypothetical protein
VIKDVAGDDRAYARTTCLSRERVDANRITWPTPLEQRHITPLPEDRLEVGQRLKVLLVRLVR